MKVTTPIEKAALAFRTRALKLPRAKREAVDALTALFAGLLFLPSVVVLVLLGALRCAREEERHALRDLEESTKRFRRFCAGRGAR